MAGESPDRSEQRKSSGETVSGERDPRLAMIRAAGDPPRAEGRTDQATAVFRVPPAPEAEVEAEDEAENQVEAEVENQVEAEVENQVEAEGEAKGGTDGVGDVGSEDGAESDSDSPESAEQSDASDKSETSREFKDSEDSEDPEESDEPAGADADTTGDDGDEADDARLRKAVASWVSTAAEAQEESSESSEDVEADDASDASGESDDVEGSDEDVEAADEPGEPSDAEGSDEDAEAADAQAEGATDEAQVAEAAEDDAQEGSAQAAAPKGGETDKPVDQATAVFKLPTRRTPDQPTTALKITPPAAKPEPKPESKVESKPESDSKPEAESASERTSTFVPLRRDDSPVSQTPKPAQSSSAPASSSATTATAPPTRPAQPAQHTQTPAALTEPERTKQQPLPPKPPLDLLAELTNTPPPPQTPLRTVLRRVRIWTPLVVLLLIVFAIVQMVRPLPTPTLSLTAKPTHTFEGSAPQLPWPAEGQAAVSAAGLGSLGTSGEQMPVPIASVTKAMTAYVILKDHPLKRGEEGPMIEIDAKGAEEGGRDKTDNESTLNSVKEGDKISLKDALSAIMIPSANNIARQLARWDSGSEQAFVVKMNAAAKELGMTDTTYTDPSGLEATTVSTAVDQVKLGLKLVEIPALMDITKLPKWKDPSGTELRNYNDLVPYDGAIGIKTGSTTKAGGNLLFAAHKMVGDTDQLIVGAVLAQHGVPILGTAINASKEVMLATQEALTNATIVKKGQVVGAVQDGLGGSVPLVATKDVTAVGWAGLTVKLKLSDGGKTVPHAAKAGTAVGTLTVGEGASQVAVPVALQSDLVEPGAGERLTRVG
ncbi:hypothetical protein [Streptomyces sp. NPDC127084]|uniref:hypothetical protein n=1 Tax=Streptomyces sp. NPDC127084 TaxID=3347133 RepID=UPI0036638EDA